MPKFRKILAPVDFSEGSRAATEYAAALAHIDGATLTLLHVRDVPALALPEVGFSYSDVLTNAMKDTAFKLLEECRTRVVEQDPQLTVETKLTFGTPKVEILREATLSRHDLIVLGTHGRTGIAHALLGSVAERVVQMARCPVLTVRTPQ
jgi:nucleotide-binding universal stress UspA family protein